MIAIVHSIYSQSVHAPALNAGLMDNDVERYCILYYITILCDEAVNYISKSKEQWLFWNFLIAI